MTELQKIEFEMLKLLVDVCEKLKLKYYLVCGSALGAVKYSGFIPWDDDIDVALPREDYEVLLSQISHYLPENIFLQNYRTDPNFPLLGSKLRNTDTTFIEVGHSQIDMHHGIFIDIFPLDGYPMNKMDEKTFIKEKKRYLRSIAAKLSYNRFSKENIFGVRTNIIYFLHKVFGLYSNTAECVSRYERFISKHSTLTSNIWCNHANSASEKEFSPKLYYGEGIFATFEGLRVRIPEKYDEYLSQKYGNWRSELPKEKQKSHHYYVYMDTKKTYKSYINIKENGKIQTI